MKNNRMYGGHALRIAVGITMLALLLAGLAGAATPVSSCGTISSPGEYVLNTNLTSSSTCINITSSDVSFDGASYLISRTGIYRAGTYGVYVNNHSITLTNITVKNLKVTNWGTGIYYQNVNNGNISNTASSGGNSIFLNQSGNSTISGNTASSDDGDGISLYSSSNSTVSGNTASSIISAGISLYSSSNSTISGNYVSGSHEGIFLFSSGNSTVSGNTASNNIGGIRLSFSGNSIISGNTASRNLDGDGIQLSSSGNSTVSGNSASDNGLRGIILSSSSNSTVSDNTANGNYGLQGGIFISSSNNNTVSNNIASGNNWYGIFISSSNNNTVSNNTVSSNYGPSSAGIFLSYSNDNMVSSNIASNNGVYGISLFSSSNNLIYNNIFNNTNNYHYDSPADVNFWNITKTPSKNIIGGPNLGGNFWANPSDTGFSQTCIDDDNDGICDSPYTIDTNNIDYLPLTELKPTIVVYTDKTGYIPGNKMYVGLNITNPGNARNVGIYIWIDLPDGGKFQIAKYSSVTLPAGLDYNKMPLKVITLPNIPPGNYAWHAMLWDPVANESISESISPWTFSTAATAGAGSIKELENAFQGGSEEIYFVK